jgi:hypothetical protein
MRHLIIGNVVVAAILCGVCGALLHLLVGRGGAGRTALKTIGIILLTGAPTPYVEPSSCSCPGCRKRTAISFAAR